LTKTLKLSADCCPPEISAESYPLMTKVTLKVIRYFFGEKISVDRCPLKLVLHLVQNVISSGNKKKVLIKKIVCRRNKIFPKTAHKRNGTIDFVMEQYYFVMEQYIFRNGTIFIS
jgi:hypothetical protein